MGNKEDEKAINAIIQEVYYDDTVMSLNDHMVLELQKFNDFLSMTIENELNPPYLKKDLRKLADIVVQAKNRLKSKYLLQNIEILPNMELLKYGIAYNKPIVVIISPELKKELKKSKYFQMEME